MNLRQTALARAGVKGRINSLDTKGGRLHVARKGPVQLRESGQHPQSPIVWVGLCDVKQVLSGMGECHTYRARIMGFVEQYARACHGLLLKI
jgi:hypothetical protein